MHSDAHSFLQGAETCQSVPVAPMDTAEIGNIVANNYWPTPVALMDAAQLDGPAKQFVEAMCAIRVSQK